MPKRISRSEMFEVEQQKIDVKPESVTLYANHPLFAAAHQMHETEKRLFRSSIENIAMREEMDALAKKIRAGSKKETFAASLRRKTKSRKK